MEAEHANFSTGSLAELMGNPDEAMVMYEHALRANPNSIPALNAMSVVLRNREDFPKAAEYLNAILKLDGQNGEAWGSLGAHPRRVDLSWLLVLTRRYRPLLSDDGRASASVHGVPECLDPPPRSEGESAAVNMDMV